MNTLCALLLAVYCQLGDPAFVSSLTIPASAGAGATYLLEENCEDTGTPAGWTDTGTIEWDYTSTVLQGSQSVRMETGEHSYSAFTSSSDVWFYCLINPSILPAGTASFAILKKSAGDVTVLALRMNATGNISIMNAAFANATFTVNAMSTGTTYHVWIHYVSGGTSTVGFSTDGTRPTSGDSFTSISSTANTVDKMHIIPNRTAIFDRILVDNDTIGNNP